MIAMRRGGKLHFRRPCSKNKQSRRNDRPHGGGSREMAIEWKTKLLERLNKSDLTLNSEDDRVLKEVALFAEKCGVSEEISRLRSHLGQIRETVSEKVRSAENLNSCCKR